MAYTSVKLTADSSSFKQEMQSATNQMKMLSSEYSVAKEKAKLFGTETDNLKAKAESLTKKIEVQKSIVKLNEEQQGKLTSKLSDQKTKQAELTAKIDAAKKAYEEETKATGKNSDESKALKEELDKLEEEFKKNETAIGKTETALANQTAKTDASKVKLMDMEKELENVNKELKNHKLNEFADACGTAGEKIEGFGKKLSVISGGVTAFGVGSGKMAIDFEDSMAKVSTIMDESVMSVGDMEDAIVTLSNETGIAVGDIADNVYNAISAGQNTADAVNFVRESTKLATAGFAESGDTLDILTTVLNAYGLEAGEVTNVSDMLVQTQNLGKTTVAELSSAMGKVIPTANANGVALDQLCAGYAIMTANGVATAETTTYMNSMLNELGKTGSDTDSILREKTGQSFKELMDSGSSLADVLTIIDDAAGEQNLTMSDMFSSSEAAKAGLILLGDGADSFNGTLGEMQQSAGMTDDAFGKMQTTSYDLKVTINNVKNTAMEFGQTIMQSAGPMIESASEKVKELCDWFSNLDEGQQNTILKVGLVVAAVGPLAVGFGKVAQGISSTIKFGQNFVSGVAGIIAKITAKTAATAAGTAADAAGTAAETAHATATAAAATTTGGMTAAQTALNAVMNLCPIILIITLIVGLIAAGVALYKNWDTVKEKLAEFWAKIKEIFEKIKEAITGAFTKAKEAVTDKVNGMVDAFKNSPIGKVASTIFGGVKDIASTVMSATFGKTKEHLGNMKKAYEENGGGIKGVVAAGWEGIKGHYTDGFNAIDKLSGGKLTEIKDKYSNIMSETVGKAKEHLNSMKDAYEENGGGVKGIVAAAYTGVKDTMDSIMGTANTLTGGKLDQIKSSFSSKLEGAKNTVDSVMGKIKDSFQTKMDNAKNAVSGVIDKIKGFFNFSWSLPKLKMPHPKVSGSFSLNPPSVPSFSIEWYKTGGIMTGPTIFGSRGNTLLAGGEPETGGEAILPLTQFYEKLSNILDKKLDAVQKMQAVYVTNYTYIDSDEIASRTVTKVDAEMVTNIRKGR